MKPNKLGLSSVDGTQLNLGALYLFIDCSVSVH